MTSWLEMCTHSG